MIALLFLKNNPHTYHSKAINSTPCPSEKNRSVFYMGSGTSCLVWMRFLYSPKPQSWAEPDAVTPTTTSGFWKEASLDVSFYLPALRLWQEPSVHALLFLDSRGRSSSTRDRQFQPLSWLTISEFAVKRQDYPDQQIPSVPETVSTRNLFQSLGNDQHVTGESEDKMMGSCGLNSACLTPEPFPQNLTFQELFKLQRLWRIRRYCPQSITAEQLPFWSRQSTKHRCLPVSPPPPTLVSVKSHEKYGQMAELLPTTDTASNGVSLPALTTDYLSSKCIASKCAEISKLLHIGQTINAPAFPCATRKKKSINLINERRKIP